MYDNTHFICWKLSLQAFVFNISQRLLSARTSPESRYMPHFVKQQICIKNGQSILDMDFKHLFKSTLLVQFLHIWTEQYTDQRYDISLFFPAEKWKSKASVTSSAELIWEYQLSFKSYLLHYCGNDRFPSSSASNTNISVYKCVASSIKVAWDKLHLVGKRGIPENDKNEKCFQLQLC